MTNLFPEPDGNYVGVDDKGFTKTTRTDLQSYEKYLDGVEKKGPGFEARLIVPTGEPVVTRNGKRTGRGREESRHDRAFRQVAANRQIGIRINPEKMADGQTMLRIAITAKREFNDLTNARRDRGRINYQAEEAQKKAAELLQKKDPKAAEMNAHAKELFAQVKQLDVDIAAMEKVVADHAAKLGKTVENLTSAEVAEALSPPEDETPEAPPTPPTKPTAGTRK